MHPVGPGMQGAASFVITKRKATMAKEIEVEKNPAQAAGEAAVEGAAGVAAAGAALEALQNDANTNRNAMPSNMIKEAGGGGFKDADSMNKNLPDISIGKGIGGKAGEAIGKELGEKISKEMGENVLKDIGTLGKKFWNHERDGVQNLSTGDSIVKEDGKQTLFTPGGDKITINPDGTSEIKGQVDKVTNQKGITTVEFADGGKVSFDKLGFVSVERDNQAIHFGRPGLIKIPPIGICPEPIKPWIFKGGGAIQVPMNSMENSKR